MGRRVGLMIPSANTVMEPDFYRNVPADWTVHTSRMHLVDTTVAGESRMLDEYALPAALALATARPHVIVFGCTSAGSLRGNEYEDGLIDEISSRTGIQTLSVMRCVREGLRRLGAERIAVITPYVEELNERIRASLEADGFEVVRIRGLQIVPALDLAKVPVKRILDLAYETLQGLAPDALFVSCTNFPGMSALPDLRRELDFPVTSSNQIALERAIEAAEMQDTAPE